MNWLRRKLGFRDHKYRAKEFCLTIKPLVREGVAVTHTRDGISLRLDGERIGYKWDGIEVHIPQEIEIPRASQVVCDLEVAFKAMGYRYVIARKTEIEMVCESERQAAIAELRAMGYEIEVSPDGNIVRLKMSPGRTRPDLETTRRQAPRMTNLIQAVHGSRQKFEFLAQSQELESDSASSPSPN